MVGIVYCLTNPAMPDLVKIGWTGDLRQRMADLDCTPVPLPFECTFAVEVEDPHAIEKLVHQSFADHRVHPRKEFFRVSPVRVEAALKLTGGRDVTPGRDADLDPESVRALNEAREKRANFNFEMVKIEPGAELTFRTNTDEEPVAIATVQSRNRIMFEGHVMSLSAAAGVVLGRRGLSTNIAGTEYWEFKGETLADLRRRMEAAG